MVRQAHVEPAVAALCALHDHDGAPAELVRRLAHEIRLRIGEEPPVDLEVVASSLGAVVEVATSDVAGSVRWNGKNYVVTVSASDLHVRQRFTIAHELIHIIFMEAAGSPGAHVDLDTGTFDASVVEEFLCDIGASELILPTASLRHILPSLPTMDDVLRIADDCDASVEASARRVVQLAGMPGAVIVLEPKLKPVEVRSVNRRVSSPSLPGLGSPPPKPKLRVRYGVSEGLGFIPPHKSVDENCPLANVMVTGTVDYVGATGIVPGTFAVSARYLPFSANGETVERVVAIAFAGDAWDQRRKFS